MERERLVLQRERAVLDREIAALERLSAMKDRTEEVTEDSCEAKDSDTMDRKEQFLLLFEKLLKAF